MGTVLWLLVVLTVYYQENWPSFSSLYYRYSALDWPTAQAALANAKEVGLCLWLSGLFFLMGRWLLDVFTVSLPKPLDRHVFSVGLGAGTMMLIVFFLGIGGAWYPWVLWLVCILLTTAFVIMNRDLFHRQAKLMVPRIRPPAFTLVDKAFMIIIVLSLGCYLLGTLAPEIAWDSLVCHLAIPDQWLLAHRIFPTPHNLFSGVPFNMEVLYALALALANPVLAKLLHFSAGVGSLAVLFAIAEHYGSRRAGVIGCALFVSCPVVSLEFTQSAVELGSTFFGLLSVYALLLGQGQQEARLRKRWLILSGVFCGFCMGTKYTAWVLLPALLLAHGILWFSEHPGDLRGFFFECVFLAVPAFLLVSPWIIKNSIFFGNPLYPFLQGVFKNAAVASNLKGFQADSKARDVFAQFSSLRGVWQYLIEPWTITMTGLTTVDLIGPAFLALVPFLVLPPSMKSRAMTTLLWIVGVQWVFYSFSSEVVRYRVPVLGMLMVFVAIRVSDPSYPKFFKNGVFAALLLMSITNFTWANLFLFSVDGWKVTLGMMSASDYLRHAYNSYPTSYYDAAEFINHATPLSAKVMILGDPRSLYVERPVMSASLFDTHPLSSLANESPDGEALYARLREQGVTFILLNAAEASVLCGYWKGTFTDSGRAVFDQFWQKHTHLVYRGSGGPMEGHNCFVFEIVPNRASLELHVLNTQDIFLDILTHC
jgi:hypothetical protein